MRLPIGGTAHAPVQHEDDRTEFVVVLAIAWALVLLRSAVYLWYEHSFFDSDQAIFGLMAKHLIDGRAWPLFVYGQSYMLAVDAWIAVPFILVAGPTVVALHASLVFTNLVVVSLVITGLVRWSGVRPRYALAAASFFAFAPPVTAASLVEAAGNIGPFLYVPLLWAIRNRPVWFGAILAIGFLHREFTAYVVPVLVVQQAWNGSLRTRARLRGWIVAVAVALATWQAVEGVRRFSDPMGPGTRGVVIDEDAGTGVGSIARRIEFVPAEMPGRITAMVTEHFPGLFGARVVRDPIAPQGHDWLFWPFAAGILAGLAGVAVARWRSGPNPALEFPAFLAGVGLMAIAGYVITRPADFFLNRYMLLAMYVPIGTAALVFASATGVRLRAVVVAVVVLIAAGSAADHLRLASRYWGGRERNDLRELADGLVARGVKVAMAGYWRAYKITYLTGERVKVASTDVVRITEYQNLAAAEGEGVIVLSEKPCAGGTRVSVWYLCRRDGQPVADGR